MSTRIIGGFDGSNIYRILRLGPSHFSCEMEPETPSIFKYPDHHGYWFYFRIEDAYRKRVIVDITNCEWMPSHWRRYRPVLSYFNPGRFINHEWERIDDAALRGTTFRFAHTYESEVAWVALRYPYTYAYHRAYMERIRDDPSAEVETIAMTREGRRLDVVTITDPDVPLSRKRTILIYAREHGVEQEGSWVCQGVMDFLLSEAQAAERLRQRTVFFVVPISSPDAAYHGRCTDPHTGELIACDFTHRDSESMKMVESRAIWKKVEDIAAAGNSIDICISLHSPHGWEANVWSHLHGSVRRKESKRLNRAIFSRCDGFTKKGPRSGWGRFSLPGRCAREFESIALLLEINQHAKRRFLSLEDLRRLGRALCEGILDRLSESPTF